MKYRPSRSLAVIAGDMLERHAAAAFGGETEWEVIVPMPISPFNRKRRRFNQCEVMASRVLRSCRRGTHLRNVLRHSGSTPQAWLDHDARVRRIQGMFLVDGARVKDRHVLLVEDVITTGSSSAAAVAAMLDSGARTVDIFALARTSVWQRFRGLVHKRVAPKSVR